MPLMFNRYLVKIGGYYIMTQKLNLKSIIKV